MNIKMLKAALLGLALSVSGFTNAALLLTEVSDNAYITVGGYDIAWISPLSSNSSTIDLSYQSQFGWSIMSKAIYDEIGGLTSSDFSFDGANVDYVTGNNLDEISGANVQYAVAPAPLFDVAVATPWFSTTYTHIDWGQGTIGAWSLADWESPLSCPNTCNETLAVRVSHVESVPEPSTLAIFALGFMGLASRIFKKQ